MEESFNAKVPTTWTGDFGDGGMTNSPSPAPDTFCKYSLFSVLLEVFKREAYSFMLQQTSGIATFKTLSLVCPP